MIQVCELFFLKDGLEGEATQVMQILDDLLGPAAHAHPGWCGHATFLQSIERSSEILMIYPWRNLELYAELCEQEESLLADFYRRYCTAPRRISFFRQMAVKVEHDEDGVSHTVTLD